MTLSSLRIDRYDRFAPELSAAWEELSAPYGAYQSQAWLEGLERRLQPRYLVVRDGDRPLGAAVLYSFRDLAEMSWVPGYYDVAQYHFRMLAGEGAPALESRELVPTILFGVPITGTEQRLLLKPGLSPDEQVAVFSRIVDAVEAAADEIGARLILFPFMRLPALALAQRCRPRGMAVFGGPTYELDVPASFDGYLDRFKAQGRSRIRRDIRDFVALGLRFETRPLEPCLPFLQEHYVEAMARHPEMYGSNPERPAMTTLEACISATSLCRAIVALRGDELVAVWTLFGRGDILQAKTFSILPSFGREGSVYFNGLYEIVRFAAAGGYRTIDLGGAAHQAKLSRAFRAVPLFSLMLARGDCPLPSHRAFLRDQSRAFLAEIRGEVEKYGQYENQVETDLGDALAWAKSLD